MPSFPGGLLCVHMYIFPYYIHCHTNKNKYRCVYVCIHTLAYTYATHTCAHTCTHVHPLWRHGEAAVTELIINNPKIHAWKCSRSVVEVYCQIQVLFTSLKADNDLRFWNLIIYPSSHSNLLSEAQFNGAGTEWSVDQGGYGFVLFLTANGKSAYTITLASGRLFH